nr:acyl carrier protein [uncultured Flavobacterium sp.]
MNTKVIAILNEIRPEFNFSEPIANFIEAGMLDSFDVVTLVTTLDEEFGISIEGIDILPENFSSVQSIVVLLSKYAIK